MNENELYLLPVEFRDGGFACAKNFGDVECVGDVTGFMGPEKASRE